MSNETAELACSYASLILYDDGQDITGDKISALVQAAGIEVQSYWPKLFAKAIEGQDVSALFNFGGATSGPAQGATQQAPQQAAKEAPKDQGKKGKKQQPKPAEEEEDVGMGGLFD